MFFNSVNGVFLFSEGSYLSIFCTCTCVFVHLCILKSVNSDDCFFGLFYDGRINLIGFGDPLIINYLSFKLSITVYDIF